MKTIRISKPIKRWWPGDKRVEEFMPPVTEVIKKYHKWPSDEFTEIYNKAYEAVYATIKKYADGKNVKMVACPDCAELRWCRKIKPSVAFWDMPIWYREGRPCPTCGADSEKGFGSIKLPVLYDKIGLVSKKEMQMSDKKQDFKNVDAIYTLRKLTEPLIKHLNDNYHPYVTVIVTPTSVELLEGIMCDSRIYDFVKD
ncbi:MAG: hypothetical protein ACE5HX_15695 [bacterium]